MKKKNIISCLLLFFLLEINPFNALYAAPKRIVSVAPAITEIVFALGKGDSMVGNSNYCNYPEAAKKVPRIGGLMDINLELLISKKPAIVFLYPEHYKKLKVIESSIRLVTVKHTTISDILKGIKTIAKELEVEERGKKLVAEIKDGLNQIRKKVESEKKLKTLLIIGRSPNTLNNMYIIGARDFLTELLEISGGVNAYTGTIGYPNISTESVMSMAPDVIIELSAFNEGIGDADVMKVWGKFPFIPAVKNKKITIVKDSVWLIPGPRIVRIAREMQKLLH